LQRNPTQTHQARFPPAPTATRRRANSRP
jgi:hypothetical protein